MKCDPVRLRALEILLEVDAGERLEPALAAGLAAMEDPRSSAFLAELVRGTIQWQARYDHVIAAFSRKRPPNDPVLIGILRLSLHQLLGLDGVPPYAAIHQAGELCHRKSSRGKVGFINGMLQAIRRRVVPQENDRMLREDNLRELFAELESDRPRWLAAWYSLPSWLVNRWIKSFGLTNAEELCVWVNEPVALHLHVLANHSAPATAEHLIALDLNVEEVEGPGTLFVTDRPSRQQLRDVLASTPQVIVQDISVQQATKWLATGMPTTAPVLDMCAAPGGKTAHLCGLLGDSITIVGMDNKPTRVALLSDTLSRVAENRAPIVIADGGNPPFANDTFGGILLDGPCSGTGVLRHHPDGRWLLKASTPANKAKALLNLAHKAADMLVPGGRLMYATCSLEPEENDQVISALLEQRSDLEPDPGEDGLWRKYWLPFEKVSGRPNRGDGFFAARLKKSHPEKKSD
ncbi:MAG: 16S rRNA (cytosine967-C5)-methyltransferase [Candidatus Krumholzibacteriia bacterium]|jgi:16S rRNA (cytosine967-C5)-methyltransferase